MILKEKIQQNLNAAIRGKRATEVSVLRMLSAAILNKEKEKRYKLSKEKAELTEEELEKESQLRNEEVIEVIFSEAKKRKEAISEFKKGERADLVEKEEKELELLKKYLPEQLSGEEIKNLAKETIEKTKAEGMKDIGRVMRELMPKVKGRTGGSQVSRIVKELLEK